MTEPGAGGATSGVSTSTCGRLDEAASETPRLGAVYGRLHRSYGVLPWETVPAPALRVDRRKTADLRERFLAALRQLDL